MCELSRRERATSCTWGPRSGALGLSSKREAFVSCGTHASATCLVSRTAALLEALTRGHGLRDVELLDSMRPSFAALAIELGDLQAFQGEPHLCGNQSRTAHAIAATSSPQMRLLDGNLAH